MKMSNSLYDILKWLTVVVLPALATFYALLANTWNLPYSEQIPTTITGLSTLLGACLMISSSNYNKEEDSQGE